MKILFTTNTAWNILNFRLPVVRVLLARGDVVAFMSPYDDTVARLESVGMRYIPLEMDNKGLNPVRDAGLAIRFWQCFRSERPDVILSWTIKNNIFGALAAKAVKIPFIPNVSGLGTAFLSGGTIQYIAETLYKVAFKNLNTVFFQNEDDRELFIQRRLVTIDQAELLSGSGINLQHFSYAPIHDGPPIFLMIARLLYDKGVLEYVEAARRVRNKHPEIRFQLLGATDSANRTAIDATTVKGWQTEGIIEYLNTTDDVRPYIAASSCVVLPSYREGAPRTLIEAGAMGRPVIATNVPGCRAVVDNAITGLLCEARSGESLAEVCLKFLDMSIPARVAMGQAGRARMENTYDEALVAKAYLEAIDRVLA